MLLPCEVAVKSVIPAIRSAIARELTESYGLKQKDVAELLGVTQTAVSKYTSHCRGAIFEVYRSGGRSAGSQKNRSFVG